MKSHGQNLMARALKLAANVCTIQIIAAGKD